MRLVSDKLEIVCTVCPTGCGMQIHDHEGEIKVVGNLCIRGYDYAVAELTNPLRTLTTTMRLSGSDLKLLPVRTSVPVPKDKMREIVLCLNRAAACAPIASGDVVVPEIRRASV